MGGMSDLWCVSNDEQERFWKRVEQRPGTCWPWLGALDRGGYGTIRVSGKKRRAHRVAWYLHTGLHANGPVDHKCHNRACVNPEHLQVVTTKQNAENRVGARVDSRSGVRGVHRNLGRGKPWTAYLTHNYRRIHLGYFDTLEEADAAVRQKRRELYTNSLMDRSAA